MSVNNISETQRKMNLVERKLMYKSHGQWAVKTTGTIALGALAAVGGKLVKGSSIDVTGKTVSEIASLASQQASVLSAVQTVDGSLASALTKSNEVTKAGGTITRGADINAASMTASEAVSRTSQSIHEICGKTITVPVKQTEGISI